MFGFATFDSTVFILRWFGKNYTDNDILFTSIGWDYDLGHPLRSSLIMGWWITLEP